MENKKEENKVMEAPDFVLNDSYISKVGLKGITLYSYLRNIFLNEPEKLKQDSEGKYYYVMDNYEIMKVTNVSYGIAIRLKKKLGRTKIVNFFYNKKTDETVVYLNRYN